ncbi:hypothetical protein EB796_021892 [Bugula neritina]|uniref:Uncharacterized protein n=1 Tax=Bugula neritina TaxID=10212 RepID=A0A7J7J0U2_BUGNE|nr:hypothetical protein EB796_021892 [Bugula neritina]
MSSALGTIVKDAIEMSVRGYIPGISFDSRSLPYMNKVLYSNIYSIYLRCCIAAERGDVDSITKLLSIIGPKDGSVNQLNSSGLSPLHIATKQGHSNVILALSQHPKFDINGLCKDGYAALHLAVKHRKVKCVKMLLDRGANLNVLDVGGKTALHMAARKANIEIVKIIMKQPNVNVCIEGQG